LNRLPTDDLSAVLERLDVPVPVSEAQGLACGLLCSRPASNAKSRWFAELLDAAALVPEALAARAADLRALDEWFGVELAALNDAELDFALALPDDERPLAERARSLGEFCAGFVYGVGIGVAARGNPPLPEDTRELIEDFVAIDGAGEADVDTLDGAGDGEGAESGGEDDFVQLVEYVRVGVLLVNEELKPVTTTPSDPRGKAGAAGARRVH